MVLLWDHALTAGDAGNPPWHWPADAALQRDPDRPTLVLFAHPRCPCTRASIGELAWVMERSQGRARAYVLFLQPAEGEGDEAWTDADTVTKASAIPGVTVRSDIGGAQAKRFGVKISGHVLYFDQQGSLRFSGGITAARGHAGASVGREALMALLEGHTAGVPAASVFGCPLCNPSNCDFPNKGCDK
jgi:hypothetical protein